MVAALSVVAVAIVGFLVVTGVLLDDSSREVPVDVALERYRSEETDATVDPEDRAGSLDARPAPGSSQVPAGDGVPDTSDGAPATADRPAGAPASRSADDPATGQVDGSSALVAPGVYRYRTTGGESIDALGGAAHEYPDETTITVTRHGCGVHLRWDPLVERRDEWELCSTTAGIELQPIGVQFHQFFGRAEQEDVVCDGAVLLLPAGEATRPTAWECMLAEDPWSPTWEVIGQDRRRVDGEWVDVTHVRMTVEDDDEEWEHTVVDWFLAADGLPVAARADKESRSPSPIGGVVYREQYAIDLVSTVPLQ